MRHSFILAAAVAAAVLAACSPEPEAPATPAPPAAPQGQVITAARGGFIPEGIEADEPRDRLLVTNSDRAAFGGDAAGQAKLGVYNLTTGERLAMVDLGAT